MERARRALSTEIGAGSVLVRILDQTGIALRDAAEALVITGSEVSGSLMNGVINQPILDAVEAHPPPSRTVLEIDVSDAEAEAASLVCGGSVRLLLTPVVDLPAEVGSWMNSAHAVALVCAADGSGTELAVTAKLQAGSLGSDQADELAVTAAREILRQGSSVQGVQEIEGIWLSMCAAVPTTRAVIVGSGPMAESIGAQGELMGWQVTVSEDVPEIVSFCATAGSPDALVVISHDPEVYTPTLQAALESAVGYIGAMGSRRTQVARAERLEAIGFDANMRARIHGPVGLDLGARTPAETAVEVAAEFLASRTAR